MKNNFSKTAFFLLGVIALSLGNGCTKEEKAMTEISEKTQTLGMETLGNARELGGYKTTDGHTVKRGVLLRTAKPCGASETDKQKLVDTYHLAVITDFRMSYEREAEPNPALSGVEDVWCPIIDENLIWANVSGEKAAAATNTFERLKIAIDSGIVSDQMYVQFLQGEQGKKGYAEFFKQLLSLPEGKSLLFHCTQGKDRTGTGAMLILSALGVDEETIMQDYLLTNVFNAPLIEKERQMLSQYNLTEEEMNTYLSVMDQVNPAYMQNALDWLKKEYGSVTGYITTELGVTQDDIETLKAKFLE